MPFSPHPPGSSLVPHPPLPLLLPAGACASDPGLLWFLSWLAARLPFRRMDEPLALLAAVSGLLGRRGEPGVEELKDRLAAEKAAGARQRGIDGAPLQAAAADGAEAGAGGGGVDTIPHPAATGGAPANTETGPSRSAVTDAAAAAAMAMVGAPALLSSAASTSTPAAAAAAATGATPLLLLQRSQSWATSMTPLAADTAAPEVVPGVSNR